VNSNPTAPDFSLAQEINLRDLGGPPTRDGRRVRIGRIYRSAALTAFGPGLGSRLRELGIRTVVDLRHNLERAAHPSPWEEIGSSHYWYYDHDAARGDLNSWLRGGHGSAASLREAMLQTYRALPYSQVEAHRYLFNALIDGRTPLLFNCSAGKDRTGVAAAIVLAALGVKEDAIITDYLQTAAFDLAASRVFRREKPTPPERAAILAPLFATDPAYLAAMFESIEARAGSLKGYLHNTLDIDDARLTALRDQLLER
jgi:protein-tyrosine phosphatase